VRRNVIRFLMPLTISEELLEEALAVLDRALGFVQAEGAAARVRASAGE